MPDPASTATFTLHHICVTCKGAGSVPEAGRAVRCVTCNGRGTWDEAVTREELSVWIDTHLGARHEVSVREIVQDEVKRAVRASVTTGKKGSKP